MASQWDSRIPVTADEVVKLLQRRIEVHARWRDALLRGDPGALESSKHGVGTVQSHQTYIDQYDAAIAIIRAR